MIHHLTSSLIKDDFEWPFLLTLIAGAFCSAEFDGRTRRHAIGRSSSDDVIRSRAVPRGRVGPERVSRFLRALPMHRRATVWSYVRRRDGRRNGSQATGAENTADGAQVLSSERVQQVPLIIIIIEVMKSGKLKTRQRYRLGLCLWVWGVSQAVTVDMDVLLGDMRPPSDTWMKESVYALMIKMVKTVHENWRVQDETDIQT